MGEKGACVSYGALDGAVRVEVDELRKEELVLSALEADMARAKSAVDAVGDEMRDSHALLDALEAGVARAHAHEARALAAAARGYDDDASANADALDWRRFCALLAPAVALLVLAMLLARHLFSI